MSCIHCSNKIKSEVVYPCLCDRFVHPEPLNIDTGLDKLPRQIATFPQFRRAMLHALRSEEVQIVDGDNHVVSVKPLSNWRARDKDDLGIMLLEMWAYICDAVSFYDEVIANEIYLRTSFLRPNLRKLVALLGYLPRPAVGSSVYLAAKADGRLQVTLPAGTAFRSGAFNGNPSQVFELAEDTFIHPLLNKFLIKSPHAGIVKDTDPHDALLINPEGEILEGMLLLLVDKVSLSNNKPLLVNKFEKYNGTDNLQYNKLTFTSSTGLAIGTRLENLRLMKYTQSAGIWVMPPDPSSARDRPIFAGSTTRAAEMAMLEARRVLGSSDSNTSVTDTTLTLNTVTNAIRPGDYVIVVYRSEKRWFLVSSVYDVTRPQMPAGEITINGNSFSMPGVTIPVTQITLDVSINADSRRNGSTSVWNTGIAAELIVYFGMFPIATVTDEPNRFLLPNDQLFLDGVVEKPEPAFNSSHFLLQDKNTIGADIGGSIDFEGKRLITEGATWEPGLVSPVEAFGNIIKATRGEKVTNEKMGSGDASVSGQTFKLKKKPLTYFMSPSVGNDQLVKNTLTVHVNGIRWKEVNSFFGQKENDQVYIVRQNDEGDSWVTFGDGIRGQRLPSGIDNLIANYRFGAEAACPPAASVNQIAKSVKGLQSVKNHLAAFGGADAEGAENLRTYAPKSALILGRVVSIKDMEALAATYPGVRSVQSEWRWDKIKQRATAHIFYIGSSELATDLSRAIRSVSDPTTPITVENAVPKPLHISLSIQIDPRYFEQDVLREIRKALTNINKGMLAPENVGISQPLYRSKLFDEILKVNGAQSVQGVFIDSVPFNVFASVPGTGYYFDIEQGNLTINGKDS